LKRWAAGAAAVLVLLPAAPARAATSKALFRLADARITEASGIAIGRRSPGVVYVQNDSGDTNRFFALDARTGTTAATVSVAGAENVDWEDIAVAPSAAGTSSVWLGDIGDNDAQRAEVRIYRVPEPRIRPGERDAVVRTPRATVWRLRYPDGPANAEALAVTPRGVAYVITKSTLGHSSVYRVPAKPDRQHVQTLLPVGAIQLVPHGTANPFGVAGELAVTGGAFSPDGRLFAVRTYAAAYVWSVHDGDLAAALRNAPRRITLPRQPQGEGIALTGRGSALVDSEGVGSAVYEVPVPRPAASNSSTPSRSATSPTTASASGPPSSTARSVPATPTAAAGGRDSGGPAWWPFAVGAGALVLLSGAAWRLRVGRTRSWPSPRSTRRSP
jgi:hypothetical protein